MATTTNRRALRPIPAARPKAFTDPLKPAIAAEVELERLGGLGLRKGKVDPALRWWERMTGTSVERCKEVTSELRSLSPDAAGADVVLAFFELMKRRALDLPGDLLPPVAGWLPKDELLMLGSACQLRRTTAEELIGAAWYAAGQERPDVFANGIEDVEHHADRVSEIVHEYQALAKKRNQLLQEAADAVTWDDMLIEFDRPGLASIWYRLSGRYGVPARPLGDVRGIIELVGWLRRHPEVFEGL